MIFGRYGEWRQLLALACAGLLIPGSVPLVAQQPAAPAQQAPAAGEKPKLKSAEQLDSLVAPIALYPDPLLAQVLAASTYPLEIVQAQRWFKENAKLTGENLTKAAAANSPGIQVCRLWWRFPDALKLLDENIQWTTDLGNAFLEQQSDVMDAVQRMRKKAKDGANSNQRKSKRSKSKPSRPKRLSKFVRPTLRLFMCPPITRRWCMGRRFMPILLSFTHRHRPHLRRAP